MTNNSGGGGGSAQAKKKPKTTPTPQVPNPGQTSAYTTLENYFASLGMSVTPDLSKIIKEMMTGGYTAQDITLFMPEIEKTKSFQQRFPGYEQRIKNGYNAIDLGTYIQLEDQYHNIMQQAGLPKGFYDDPSDYANFIANDVSPNEIQTRVQDAVDLTNQIDPTMRNIMAKYYGLSTGDLAAYFLDTKRALPTIQKQYNASGIAAAAQNAGLVVNDMSRYEDLTDKGVTAAQAQQAYGTVAALTNNLGQTAHLYGESYTQTDAENDVFFNDSAKRQKLVGQEAAAFNGKGTAGNTGTATRNAY